MTTEVISQYGTDLYLMGVLFENIKFTVFKVQVVHSNATASRNLQLNLIKIVDYT